MQGDEAVGRALALVRDLRARCPWDGAQTRETLRPYLVEEILELDQAIRDADAGELRDELGDVLLHLAFQIVIGEERREFDAESVTRALEEKMWRRHPHLFAGADRSDHDTWERTKRKEPGRRAGVLGGLPRTMPPLLGAFRLQERAAGVGFDWPNADGPLEKVREETVELERELGESGTPQRVREEIGDLLFAVVNLARKLGVEPGQALEQANEKFRNRFAAVEQLAAQRGIDVGEAGLEVLDRLWNEVKRT